MYVAQPAQAITTYTMKIRIRYVYLYKDGDIGAGEIEGDYYSSTENREYLGQMTAPGARTFSTLESPWYTISSFAIGDILFVNLWDRDPGADDLIMEGPLYFTLDDAKSKNENNNYMYVSFYFVSNG